MKTRNTLQKKIIMEAMEKLFHPTADEVFCEVSREYPAISKATVYRNLNQMAEQGTLLKIPIPDGADRFDITVKNHYHIRCSCCGRVYDVDMPYFSNLESQITDAHGFDIKGHEIIFAGICPDCKLKIEKSTKKEK